MTVFCCEQRRREAVRAHGTLNGIDFLEVLDRGAPSAALRQRTLYVHFLKDDPPLGAGNLRIEGGERIRNVATEWAALASDPLPPGEDPALVAGLTHPARVLLVRVSEPGDFSTYTLRLVAGPGDDEPPQEFDPLLAAVSFSFKVECGSDFDCRVPAPCPPPAPDPSPIVDYLAKDYASFRRLMLDRMALLAPSWRERNAADVGVALVELLAYVGDQLSYTQDAVATEAYLKTARRRVSVRRHARLVDYLMHDGCNARAFVQIKVTADGVPLARSTPLLTSVPGLDTRIPPASSELEQAIEHAVVFETMEDARLYEAHNEMQFYTWGDRRCCLPRGATRATLATHLPRLKAGDVLIFAETVNPATGKKEDADRTRRVAVRLEHVVLTEDPAGGRFLPEPNDDPVPVTEIRWRAADALPFPVCLSAVTDREHGEQLVDGVGIALGNIVTADHGRSVVGEDLGIVPNARLYAIAREATTPCRRPEPRALPPRFRPALREAPVTQTEPFAPALRFSSAADAQLVADLDAGQFTPSLRDWLADGGIGFTAGSVAVRGGDGQWSLSDGALALRVHEEAGDLAVLELGPAAASAARQDPHRTLPAIELASDLNGRPGVWRPRRDLLASDAEASELVVEVRNDGRATLRFGDDVHGKRPDAGTRFTARYRVGNGTAGNVGAESIKHVVTADTRIDSIRNPLAATGGHEPESIEETRRDAPQAFRVQERAVTPADYAAMAERHPDVQRAAATFRWTGSWHTVFVTVDRRGGAPVDAAFERELRAHLERYRMAGYDVEVDAPRFVSIDVTLEVCVQRDYFRADVKRALLEVVSSRLRPDGARGLFHADNFTFGQPVYMSALLGAAQQVAGVASAVVTRFERRGRFDQAAFDAGVLGIGPLEIARLDNDPNFPERGTFELVIAGGGK